MITFDPMTRDLEGPEDDAVLTPHEARILDLFLKWPDIIVSRKAIFSMLYSGWPDADVPRTDTVHVYMTTLRRKLLDIGAGADAIRTYPRNGWMLTIPIKIIKPTQVQCDKCGSWYMAPGGDDVERAA